MSIARPDINRSMSRIRIVLKRRMLRLPGVSCRKGFTLIEIILVITIAAILTSFTTINFISTQSKDHVNSTASTLTADIKEQQIKATSGDTEGSPAPSQFGIFFEPTRYTLFRGTTFSPIDPNNFEINLNSTITLSNNLPSSQIVFAANSGEWQSFASGQNSITVLSSQGEQKIITINRYGAVNLN